MPLKIPRGEVVLSSQKQNLLSKCGNSKMLRKIVMHKYEVLAKSDALVIAVLILIMKTLYSITFYIGKEHR